MALKNDLRDSEQTVDPAGRESRLRTVENTGVLLERYRAVEPGTILHSDGIRELHLCENNCELLRHFDSASSAYYRENIAEFADLSMRYGYLLRSGAMVPLGIWHFGGEIRYGLITLVDLEKNDFIGQYTGVVQVSDGGLAYENGQGYSSDYAWDYPDYPEDWPDIEISAENAGNALRYANHSFDPNCRVEHTLLDGVWVLFFLADRDIPAGTQLLVNYGEDYWTNDMRDMVYI
ncbi:SET domain-containing protein-lysine N-methyltransferase [Candidatus Haliotispira prima]|uniref:SET domain-containing protein-lysine N-methyltransferase n=1 Tax=Candidatus Haliotispira prima TaxID=3034016 RepID=A0ABY8MJ76_9SPIO|nr:SET domain-containing protein-lysine N-methyltransferase [Candidatus Haliotispira prima]